MRKLIYGMGVSLDGFVAAPGDDISWSGPSEELHWYHNEATTPEGLSLYGRRLWEVMSQYWPTADQAPGVPEVEADFARRWRARPKVVFSSTVSEVDWNTTLHRGDPVEEIRRLKAQDGADMDIGGARLASVATAAGLVDEFRLFYNPVALGAGTPFFHALGSWLELRLLETRVFDGGVVLMRYERRR
jgi:dihydrofolate reductase